MQGQLWRLFEEVAKHSFTISHLKSQDNVLADRGSRRTNLIELTDEEKMKLEQEELQRKKDHEQKCIQNKLQIDEEQRDKFDPVAYLN